MRPVILIPALVVAPVAGAYFLKMFTGDAMSAFVLCLIAFITVAAWFAGPSAAAGRRAGY